MAKAFVVINQVKELSKRIEAIAETLEERKPDYLAEIDQSLDELEDSVVDAENSLETEDDEEEDEDAA